MKYSKVTEKEVNDEIDYFKVSGGIYNEICTRNFWIDNLGLHITIDDVFFGVKHLRFNYGISRKEVRTKLFKYLSYKNSGRTFIREGFTLVNFIYNKLN